MNYIDDIYGKTYPELIMELGCRFKNYWLTCRMPPKEVVEQAGVSLFTI